MLPEQNQGIITSNTQEDQRATTQIANNLQQLGHAVLPENVQAINYETPVPQTTEMKQVGAQIHGMGDLAHAVKRDLLKTEDTHRVTKSEGFLRMLIGRARTKTKAA